MTETLFAFDERNYQDCQQAFRGENNQEYYLGDYTIHSGSVINVRADKKAVGSCSIIRLRSRSRLFFRRSLDHIREDGTDVMVLWFVKRGYMQINQEGKSRCANAGEFVITKSLTPLTVECFPDDADQHEVLHVIVPSHLFRQFMPAEIRAAHTVAADGRAFTIAERLFNDVFNDDDELSTQIEQQLLNTALTVLTDALKAIEDCTQERQSLSERRFQDVVRFIEKHLSDPKLNAAMVAESCGISQRYLSHLLKQHGISFSNMVWDWRLKVAHQWLSSTSPNEISIAEIAFGVGFKSPAHFSRLFKRVYEQGPREFRSSVTPFEAAVAGEESNHSKAFAAIKH